MALGRGLGELLGEVETAYENEKGEPIDSNFSYNFYKKHYFENIDFSDPRMLRTPTLHKTGW